MECTHLKLKTATICNRLRNTVVSTILSFSYRSRQFSIAFPRPSLEASPSSLHVFVLLSLGTTSFQSSGGGFQADALCCTAYTLFQTYGCTFVAGHAPPSFSGGVFVCKTSWMPGLLEQTVVVVTSWQEGMALEERGHATAGT